VIRAEGLSRRFGDFTAAQDLSFEVKAGEVFALLGPNGAGKTTTVRMLACLIAPSAGRARVADLEVGREDDAIRSRIGFLTESPGLYDRLSATQNLTFFARLQGLDAREAGARVARYLDLLGLTGRGDEPVSGFSKGMRQKLAIARALLHEPQVLFLDEPTSGLDPESAHVVRDFIAGLRTEGRTVLLCTHNLDEADRLADRIGVVKQRLLAVGTAESLRHQLYGRRLVVRLRGATDVQVAAARAVAAVRGIERDGDRLVIAVPDPEAAAPAIVRELVRAGADVLSVTEERRSLEEVYLRVVHEGPGAGS